MVPIWVDPLNPFPPWVARGTMDSVPWAVDAAMPTPAMLALNQLLGAFGLAYFVYGKKNGALVPLVCGVCLMIFPYFISGVVPLLLVGLVLVVLPRWVQL